MFDDISTQQNIPTPNQSLPQPPMRTLPPRSSGVGKKMLMVLIIIILLVAIGYGGYLIYNKYLNSTTEQEVDQTKLEEEEEVVIPEVGEVILNDDADRDGLTDKDEDELGTSKISVDTDKDGLTDFDEVKMYKSDPLNSDTDGDGYLDGEEVNNGYSPVGEGKLLNFEQQVEELK